MSSPMPTVKGFTLLELLFVVVLCAIVATIGVPAFNTILTRARLRRSAETIAADLQLAHHLSVTRQVPVYVSFSITNQCYSISSEPNCSCTTPHAACLLHSPLSRHAKIVDSSQLAGVQISEARFGPTSVTSFTPPRGTARFGRIILTDRKRQRLQLRVSLPGRVRICNPDPAINAYLDYPPCG